MIFKLIDHIYKPKGNLNWSKSHAQVPFAMMHDDGFIRVFYATRDSHSRSAVASIDIDPNNPKKILRHSLKPAIIHGPGGAFDDSGVMPSWFVQDSDKLWMYYTAWNRSVEASYRLSIGMAVSSDGGLSFDRLFEGPILDRSIYDPIWVGQPCVIREDNKWKMWYLSCVKIQIVNDHPEPFYEVKIAISDDGVNWVRNGDVALSIDSTNGIDAIGRPYVYKAGPLYYMFHSDRMAKDYRHDRKSAYSIRLSSSLDGNTWSSEELTIQGLEADWCSLMNEYASYIKCGEKELLFFNGNGFGKTGFGYAERIG